MLTNIHKRLPVILVFLALLIAVPLDGMAQKSDKKNKKKDGVDNTSLFLEANTEKLLGNLDKAKALFLQCIEMDPEDAASMYELARIERIGNNSNEALEWAEKAVEYAPENVWYLNCFQRYTRKICSLINQLR